MADATKANKIAAARKKLKEFQQKGTKSDGKSKTEASTAKTAVEALSSSPGVLDDISASKSCSSPNVTAYLSPPMSECSFNSRDDLELPTNPDRTTSVSNLQDECSILDHTSALSSDSMIPSTDLVVDDTVNHDVVPEPSCDTSSLQSYFANSYDHFLIDGNCSNSVSESVPTFAQNAAISVTDPTIHSESNTDHRDVSNSNKLIEPIICPLPNYESPPVSNHNELPEFPKTQISSTENIRQLSSHLQYFIDDDAKYAMSSSYELETRNQELAAMLENQNVSTQQLHLRLEEYLNRINDLEQQLRAVHAEQDEKLKNELGPLKMQLEYHAQTIGLLVGEKSELTAALEQTQITMKQKVTECEELQSRLNASRHHAGDLKRELDALQMSIHERMLNEQSGNTAKLQSELQAAKDQIAEYQQEISEALEKLNKKSVECVSFQKELATRTSQLSLTQLQLQQIVNPESSQLESQVEILNKEKIALEMKLNELIEELKVVTIEKNKGNEQYQNYVYQQDVQIYNYILKEEQLTKENERLAKRETDLLKHISTLEKDIQTLQSSKKKNIVVHKEQSQVQGQNAIFENLLADKTKEMDKLLQEKQHLLKELEGSNRQIADLEAIITDLRNDQPNSARLVAAMESDQVAAAQAIKQNAKLTQQIEELQNKFVVFSEMELKLTEKLESEQHLGKEILKQLKSSENEIDNLKQLMTEKDRIIADLEIKLGVASPSLMNASISHDNEMKQLNIEPSLRSVDHVTLNETNSTISVGITENSGRHPQDSPEIIQEYIAKSEAMQKLEERFTQTMSEIARLTEEKQQLEHLVLQLQSETETIGEYIALYQFQRGILKQRSDEKDEELRLLNSDRQEMKRKLTELNNLIRQFVAEKITPSILIQQCQKLNEAPLVADRIQELDNETKVKTADKIIELLGEINSSNLIEPKDGAAHCPLCSGQLITV